MLPTNRVRVHLSLRWPSHSPCLLSLPPPTNVSIADRVHHYPLQPITVPAFKSLEDCPAFEPSDEGHPITLSRILNNFEAFVCHTAICEERAVLFSAPRRELANSELLARELAWIPRPLLTSSSAFNCSLTRVRAGSWHRSRYVTLRGTRIGETTTAREGSSLNKRSFHSRFPLLLTHLLGPLWTPCASVCTTCFWTSKSSGRNNGTRLTAEWTIVITGVRNNGAVNHSLCLAHHHWAACNVTLMHWD